MPMKQQMLPSHQQLKYEREARKGGFTCIAGVDEAGRGPLAGPVVAAACIIPEGIYFEGIDDSKKLSAQEREKFYKQIIEDHTILHGVGIIDAILIDQINILQATFHAMMAAVVKLSRKPDYILVDGNRHPDFGISTQPIVKGDTLSQSIMAAAIIAKYTRDQMMLEFHQQWPEYGFADHKGYGTPRHLKALELHGPCPIHRKTFQPVRQQC